MKSVIVLCLFVCTVFRAFGQESTDQQLANLYYNNGEYAKALEYFEKLVNKQSTKFDLLRYAECLEKTDNLKDAEKTLKRARTQFPADMEMPILLGEFYERTERADQATKLYNELIKTVSTSGYQTVELYDVFRKKGKTEIALKTLEAGRK